MAYCKHHLKHFFNLGISCQSLSFKMKTLFFSSWRFPLETRNEGKEGRLTNLYHRLICHTHHKTITFLLILFEFY